MIDDVTLKCVAWDHPRCTSPVEASVAAFRAVCPHVRVTWERRSLFSFGEGAIEKQTDAYDLVIYDHPFVGEVASRKLMLDLAAMLDPGEIDVYREDSLGPSFRSYEWSGGLYALPIDAAAQVAAFRPDLMGDEPLPRTVAEVLDLAGRLRRRGMGIVTPLKQIDVFCLLLTLGANLGSPVSESDDRFLPDDVFEACLGVLRRLAEVSVPASHRMNPIAAHEMMAGSDDVAYSPYLFCYSNYSRGSGGRIIRSADIPGVEKPEPRGSCIGGAGIGISSRCFAAREALAYANFLCRPEYQSGEYVRNGGQPASRRAWRSDSANAISNGFFHGALATLENAYLRPRHEGFMPFARKAGPDLVSFLGGSLSEREVIARTREAYAAGLSGNAAAAAI